MEFVVQRDEGVHVEHLLLGGRRPEVEHHDLGVHLGEFLPGAVGRREVDVEVTDLAGALQGVADLQGVVAAGGLLGEGLHVAGVGIDGLQGVADALEEDAVGGLVEHGEVLVDPLEEDRHGGQGLRVFQDVAGAAAVVVHIAAGEFGIGIRGLAGSEAVHVHEELRILVLHILQEDGFVGTFHGVVAQGVGRHFHAVAGLQQERRHLPLTVEQIDEFRVLGREFHVVGEGAGSVRFHGIQDLVLADIQEFDDDRRIGLVLQGAVDDGLGAAGGEKKGRSGGSEDSNDFHTRQGWRRRWLSFPPGRPGVWACGSPCPPRSGGAPGGCACAGLPSRGRRHPRAGTERPCR